MEASLPHQHSPFARLRRRYRVAGSAPARLGAGGSLWSWVPVCVCVCVGVCVCACVCVCVFYLPLFEGISTQCCCLLQVCRCDLQTRCFTRAHTQNPASSSASKHLEYSILGFFGQKNKTSTKLFPTVKTISMTLFMEIHVANDVLILKKAHSNDVINIKLS